MPQIDVIHSLKTDIFEPFEICPNVTRNTGISMVLKLRLLLFFFLIVSNLSSFAQVSFDSQEELEKAASEFFQSQQYDKAKPLYSQLLSLNALDPNYNYRFGVCILYTEADPLKPLPYIEGGANSSGVNTEAFYFLGKAYQFNYRFDDAITYYQKAVNAGYSSANVDLTKSIQECRNGKLFYSDVEFAPAQNKEVIESEFYRPYDFRKLKGKVIPMPPTFKTKYDQKNLKGTVVYTPSNSRTLIYASYGEDGTNGKDLYRVNRLPNGEWALPQRLPDNINTAYDEDFAFFDEQSSTLFFASKGHNTMGGYDIFRSVYSVEKNAWLQPSNLQYPINSPFDDFLYVSDPNGKVAFFTSKRDSELGKLRVLKTLLHDPSQVELSVVEGTYEDKTDSIYNYMLATVFDPKTNKVLGKYRSHKETGKYVLILPPQNDYTLDVGPNESSGFQFELDVPKHEETKTLRQDITYDVDGSEGKVILTNHFNSTGKKDSIELATTRSKSEVENGMVELPDPEVTLAARKKSQETEKEKEAQQLEELAALEEAKLMAELAKVDSLKAVKQAALEAEAARLKAESAKRDSVAKAEANLKAQLAQEKAIADSIAEVELALAAQQKNTADSLAQAKEREIAAAREQAKAAEAEAKLARERAVNDSIAAAERAAFEAVLLAKEQTEKDSVEAELASENQQEPDSESFDELLKEMQEKEAEILAKQSDSERSEEVVPVVDSTEIKTEPVLTSEEETVAVSADSLQTEELISEADLFLQTLAELEEQKEAQKKEVEAENARLVEEKAKQAELELAAVVEVDAGSLSGSEESQELTVALADTVKRTVPETANASEQPVALKSDADPNEYLASLAEIEAEMEADQANNNKSYELKELEPIVDGAADIEPKLQQMIDADKKALEEHRKIAEQKEKELKAQMAREKEVLPELSDDATTDDELAQIEAELLDVSEKNAGKKLKIDGVKATEELEQTESELIAEEGQVVSELETIEEQKLEESQPSVEVELVEPAQPEVTGKETAEEAEMIAEAEEVMNELLVQEKETSLEVEVSENTVDTDVVDTETAQIANVDANEVETEEVNIQETGNEVDQAQELESVETEEMGSEVDTEDMTMSVSGQRIPFLEPALRDYSERTKPSFKSVKNPTLRRMIKRMRAEDIGRLAVLKNMKNQWVDSGKTQKSLESIKQNERNQEVLANLIEPTAREEKVRKPFDKNDTRTRDGVSYKLDFKLVSASVSETVSESMAPEQAMTFAMPEFSIASDYFQNLADARAEMRYYKQRGFDAVKVVAYQNGNLITLSDAENIPFVD